MPTGCEVLTGDCKTPSCLGVDSEGPWTPPKYPPHEISCSVKSVRTCSVEGCERKHEARGYCKMHWKRWRRTGDVSDVSPSNNRRMEIPDYHATQMRLIRDLGHASEYDCVDCGEQAQRWSYDGQDPDERKALRAGSPGLVYSMLNEHYEPRCRSCHSRHDRAMKKERDAVKTGECSHDGCDREPESRGMCHTHYMQWYRAQDDDITALIKQAEETAGFPATEAECFWCRLYDDTSVPARTWFMDEAACKKHIQIGQRWAAFALRSLKVGA